MSIESAKLFIDKLKADESFRKEFADYADKDEFIKNAGFDFSKDEMDQVKNELGDEDLAQVAGGGFSCSTQHCGTDSSGCDGAYVTGSCAIHGHVTAG